MVVSNILNILNIMTLIFTTYFFNLYLMRQAQVSSISFWKILQNAIWDDVMDSS